jgi:hypothetical protein
MTWMNMPQQTWYGVAVGYMGMWMAMMVPMMVPSVVRCLRRWRGLHGGRDALGKAWWTGVRSLRTLPARPGSVEIAFTRLIGTREPQP